MLRILVIDDEPMMRKSLQAVLTKSGHTVAVADHGAMGVELYSADLYDLVLCDMKMKGEFEGLEVLEKIIRINPEAIIVIMTAFGSIENSVKAMRKGAFDYLTKPFSFDQVLLTVARVEKMLNRSQESGLLKADLMERYSFSNITGKNHKMQQIYSLIEKIAPTSATVLITGESGTGKELVANAIHENSPRKDKPFVAVNCSALSESLLESELFGHVKGAYTGAINDQAGRFEIADGGTLFLDEIGDISQVTQVKLLRVLQERCIERVGGTKTIPIDVRILAATNKDLQKAMEDGSFRQDLYFRLNVIQLDLPPLKDRTSDIPLLAEKFCKELGEKNNRPGLTISRQVMELLMGYSWPGNVRELINVIERAVILTEVDVINPDVLPPLFFADNTTSDSSSLKLRDVEKSHILYVLDQCSGNLSQASRLLGVDRKTLYNKMKIYEEEN